jgi:hypothetical protein
VHERTPLDAPLAHGHRHQPLKTGAFFPDHWEERVDGAGYVYNKEHTKRVGWSLDYPTPGLHVWPCAKFFPQGPWEATTPDLNRAYNFMHRVLTSQKKSATVGS